LKRGNYSIIIAVRKPTRLSSNGVEAMENLARHTHLIEKKQSGTASIHSLASELYDREIVFGKDCIYAVVNAAYYGGKGYTTHKTEEATIKAYKNNGDTSCKIIDRDGNEYMVEPLGYSDALVIT
jgi:hypothetical protein